MKTTIRGLRAIILGAAILSVLVLSATLVSAGLVAHYRFDNSLNDETGRYNASLRDPLEIPLYDVGISGQSILIDSESSSLEVDPGMIELSQDFTICAWVNTSKGGEVCVLYKGPAAGFAEKSRQFNVYGGEVYGGNGIFFFTGDSGAFGSTWQTSDGITVNDGNWHHVAVSYSVTNSPHFILFVDGIGKVGSDPGAYFTGDFVMQPDGTDNVLRIGGRDNAGGYTTFSGLMDEVQIYNQALTRDQVKYLFDNPSEVILPPDMPTIRRQPQSLTVMAGASAAFSVQAEALSTLSYQWKFNGTNLAGATSDTLTISPATTNHAGAYTVLISNPSGSIISDPAILTVNVDTTPPVVQNVYGIVTGPHKLQEIMVVFSEPVAAVTAGQVANYALSGGVGVSAATVENSTTVRLSTSSSLTPASVYYTLTVNNVRDMAFGEGNLIAPDTKVSFVVNVHLPLEVGQTVKGFQDDFEAATRDPLWVATGVDAFVQDGGVLRVTGMPDDPNHLLYTAPGYSNDTQEVLARIKMNVYTTGDSRAGVAVASDPNLEHPGAGINLLFVNNNFQLLNDYVAWGPTGPAAWQGWKTNEWYWMRLRQSSSSGANNISAKVWLADGTVPEPTDWQSTWTQNGRTGYAGIEGPSNGAETDYEVDYVLIKAEGLPSIKVTAPSAIPAITPGPVSITITQQPQSILSEATATTAFSVGATVSGADTMSYQWQRNNTDIPGATAAVYTTPPLTPADQGAQYRALVSAPGANVFSASATLGVYSVNQYGGILIQGLPGRNHQIQYADTIGGTTNWVTLTTITLPSSPYLFYDVQSTNAAKRFYRAVLLPQQ
ncbi:MAG: immunoglobulin domain-containing protein [Candidatus Omnitrophica bacterium]|nr:immunoglobulin domain-containing protein [Candidatus Omnitrophota bacterium]